jgi:hypothetical protein
MIRLGVVAAGPAVRIADGTQASAGDLILCTRNDHTVHAKEPGRTLAIGDLLRIEQVTAHVGGGSSLATTCSNSLETLPRSEPHPRPFW